MLTLLSQSSLSLSPSVRVCGKGGLFFVNKSDGASAGLYYKSFTQKFVVDLRD